MSDDARDLFNIEIDEFQKKAKVLIIKFLSEYINVTKVFIYPLRL